MHIKKSIFILVFSAAFVFQQCAISDKDSVKESAQTTTRVNMSRDAVTFIEDAVDARRLDIEVGKLARDRGTTKAIREYGVTIIDDQQKLLAELKSLADKKGIVLAKAISKSKSDDLNDLKEKQDSYFDNKFYKMMKADHKRDMRDFEKAAKFEDQEIAEFARRNKPVIQKHLDRLKEINPSQIDL